MRNIEIVLGVRVTRTEFIQKLVIDHVRARSGLLRRAEKKKKLIQVKGKLLELKIVNRSEKLICTVRNMLCKIVWRCTRSEY